MKQSVNHRRSRNRQYGKQKNNQPNRGQVFDSNGPEVRIRGTAYQICEKYETLAKDARSAGDVHLAESYMQHAEHYQRLINEWDAQSKRDQIQREQQETKANNNDDLSLPTSVLGDEVKVKDEVPAEKMLETA
jgi:hypothetical protein